MEELLFLEMTRPENGPGDQEGSGTNSTGCDEGHPVNISHQESRQELVMLRSS